VPELKTEDDAATAYDSGVSVQRSKRRLLELVGEKDSVTQDDLERDIILAAEAPGNLNAAAVQLEAEGRVIVLRETSERSRRRGVNFSGLLRYR
jgi:hypothetical protein